MNSSDEALLEQFQELMGFNHFKGHFYFKNDIPCYVNKSFDDILQNIITGNPPYNIFYTPNTGNMEEVKVKNSKAKFYVESRKRLNMKELKCFYVDIDLKDEHNNSYPDSEVAIKKQELLNKLQELWLDKILKPSMIVESRNGFHLYYVSTVSTNINRWEKLENVIFFTYKQYISYTDERVRKPGQLLRFPFSIHQKDQSQKPFIVRINYINKKYTLTELEFSFFNNFDFTALENYFNITAFNKKSSNVTEQTSKSRLTPSKEMDTSDTSPLLEAIKNLDVDFFKKNLQKNNQNLIKISFEDRQAAIYHFCYQDMSKLFDIDNPQKFSSPFRRDIHPSCAIFQKKDYIYRFYDFSHENTIQGSVLDIIEKVANISKNKAIDFLAEIYNVSIPKWNPQDYHIDFAALDNIIEFNKEIFNNIIHGFSLSDKLIILYNECLELWKDGCIEKYTVPFLKHHTMITTDFLFNKLQDKYSFNNPFKKSTAIDRYMLQLEALHVITLIKGGRKVPKEYIFHKISENDLKLRCKLLKELCSNIKYMNRDVIVNINNKVIFFNAHNNTI